MHKMKLLLLPVLILFLNVNGQTKSPTEEITRRVADHILETTSFRLINSKTNEKFDNTKNLDTTGNLKAESGFNKWQYVNGVLTVGMMRLSNYLQDGKYADYSRKNFNFIFDNVPFFKKMYDNGNQSVEFRSFFRMGSLDDCGSMATGLLDVYETDKRKDYLGYLQRVGDYILNKQLKFADGTLARNAPHNMTLWADDLYMSVPFLARMSKLTGDKKYIDFAIQQVENFNKYIYDPTTGLFFHTYFNDVEMNGVARWGRSNGWVAVAQAELLNVLPADHPKRAGLIKMLLRQIVGFSRYQDTTGMWHQVLDKPDSYLESSVTAMFVYTVAKAVNEKWINASYFDIAKNGWNGLVKKVTSDGQVADICVGTSVKEDLNFYYQRPKALNDTHGLGAFLMAGVEILRAKK